MTLHSINMHAPTHNYYTHRPPVWTLRTLTSALKHCCNPTSSGQCTSDVNHHSSAAWQTCPITHALQAKARRCIHILMQSWTCTHTHMHTHISHTLGLVIDKVKLAVCSGKHFPLCWSHHSRQPQGVYRALWSRTTWDTQRYTPFTLSRVVTCLHCRGAEVTMIISTWTGGLTCILTGLTCIFRGLTYFIKGLTCILRGLTCLCAWLI